MILEISSGNEKVAVEILADGGQQKIRLGGVEMLCDWVRLADGHYSLIVDGNVLDVVVNIDPDKCVVTSSAGTYSFRVIDPRRAASRHHMEEGPEGLQRVSADMPGKVIRIMVREGDSVTFDQGILVLEAMKMQNEIRAPKSGMVREVAVVEGSTVNTGDFLLSIE